MFLTNIVLSKKNEIKIWIVYFYAMFFIIILICGKGEGVGPYILKNLFNHLCRLNYLQYVK